jgi:hypothetical protein
LLIFHANARYMALPGQLLEYNLSLKSLIKVI